MHVGGRHKILLRLRPLLENAGASAGARAPCAHARTGRGVAPSRRRDEPRLYDLGQQGERRVSLPVVSREAGSGTIRGTHRGKLWACNGRALGACTRATLRANTRGTPKWSTSVGARQDLASERLHDKQRRLHTFSSKCELLALPLMRCAISCTMLWWPAWTPTLWGPAWACVALCAFGSVMYIPRSCQQALSVSSNTS